MALFAAVLAMPSPLTPAVLTTEMSGDASKFNCLDESVIHNVGECCECKSEHCRRGEGAHGGECSDHADGVVKCCLDLKQMCYREGGQKLGACRKFNSTDGAKYNTTLYGYTEAEFDAKSAELTNKLHQEMMAVARPTSLAASEDDECDANLRKCRARDGKSPEECQAQHSTCKQNVRAREGWQLKQDDKAAAQKEAELEAAKAAKASVADDYPPHHDFCKSTFDTCQEAETAPPASSTHPLDLQCQAKFTVCKSRKQRITADKQAYEDGNGHVRGSSNAFSAGADAISAGADATSDCEAKLTSCFDKFKEPWQDDVHESNWTKVASNHPSTDHPECRAAYDNCWQRSMRKAASAEKKAVHDGPSTDSSILGPTHPSETLEAQRPKAASDAAAADLKAKDAWGDKWVAETAAEKAKLDMQYNDVQRKRDAGKEPLGGWADAWDYKPKAAKAEAEAAQKGRSLRNGDPQWQKANERCMAALADCRDGRSVKELHDGSLNAQCHVMYSACLSAAEEQMAATAGDDALHSASPDDLKLEKHAAQKGRALRNGDAAWQTGEQRCMADLADCRDGRDKGKQQTVDECHAVYTSCVAKATQQQQQDASGLSYAGISSQQQALSSHIDSTAAGTEEDAASKDQWGDDWVKETKAELAKNAKDEAKEQKKAAAFDKKEEKAEEKITEKDVEDAAKGRSYRNRDKHWNTAMEQCQASLADCRDGRVPLITGHQTPDNDACHMSYYKCATKAEDGLKEDGTDAATDGYGFVNCEYKQSVCNEHAGKSADDCAAEHTECKKKRAAEVERVEAMTKKAAAEAAAPAEAEAAAKEAADKEAAEKAADKEAKAAEKAADKEAKAAEKAAAKEAKAAEKAAAKEAKAAEKAAATP